MTAMMLDPPYSTPEEMNSKTTVRLSPRSKLTTRLENRLIASQLSDSDTSIAELDVNRLYPAKLPTLARNRLKPEYLSHLDR